MINLKIKLFWKVVVYFWLVLTAIFFFTLFFTYINSDNIRYRNLAPHMERILQNTEKKLRFYFRKEERPRRRTAPFLRDIFLIDETGVDYFTKHVPDLLNALNKKSIKEGRAGIAFRKQMLFFGGNTVTTKVGDYRLYIRQPFSFMSRGYFGEFIREFAVNLFVSTFLLSFPLSFWLAWLFTKPIRNLQTAIRYLSKDLSNKNKLHKLTKRNDEFGDLAKDFEQMATDLGEIIYSKSRLLSDVSHELKSPLARMQIALGLAEKKLENKDIREINRIKLEADRMNQMISGILDYSRFDNRSVEITKQKFSLNELIEVLRDDAQFESNKRDVSVELFIQEEIEVFGSKSLIFSCLENILRNAIRYADTKITISARLDQTSRQISIDICDDGKGVAKEQLDKLFDAFYRPESDRARDSGGVGLGLSIAKKAVELHDGDIRAINVKPHGLKISIKLPCAS